MSRFKPKYHVKKDDLVEVIAGEDKGKKGKVIEIIAGKDRVLVEGINIISKHTRPTAQYPNGGIIKKEAPFTSAMYCWSTLQQARVAAPA